MQAVAEYEGVSIGTGLGHKVIVSFKFDARIRGCFFRRQFGKLVEGIGDHPGTILIHCLEVGMVLDTGQSYNFFTCHFDVERLT